MAITDQQDTLAYHLSRPLTAGRDMSKVKVASLSAKIKKFLDDDAHPGTLPENEALWFYGLNHAMAEVRKAKALYEPLGDLQGFVEDYYRRLSPKAVRAFYYLVLICTREARHLPATPGLEGKVIDAHGATAWKWLSLCKGESDVHSKLLATPPGVTLGAYVDTLRMIFYDGKWGGGYGGPAWGAVCDCLCRFVHGEFTAEMMLDTVWTLAHNNGPIFNKGHCYGMYSSNLLKILDVQASGQMHEFILYDPLGKDTHAELGLVGCSIWMQQTFPGVIGPYVDWFLVEALGSKHKYAAEKNMQVKKHGLSAAASMADAIATKQIMAAQALQAAALEKAVQNWFVIMPNLKVKKLTRSALAA